MRSAVFVDTCDVVEHSDKAAWVSRLPNGPQMRQDLAWLVEEDHDEAETEYYEAVADPTFVTIERDQRRFRACSVAACATAKRTAAPATSSAELPICGQSVPMPPM